MTFQRNIRTFWRAARALLVRVRAASIIVRVEALERVSERVLTAHHHQHAVSRLASRGSLRNVLELEKSLCT